MVSRLDVMFRVGPTTNTLTARHDPGGGGDTGDVSVTLTDGLYTFAELMAHLQARLRALVHSSYTVEQIPDYALGYLQITSDSASNITWDHPGLRDWLGFDGDVSGSDEHAAPNPCPGVYVASYPWTAPDPLGWEWYLRGQRGPHQTGSSLKLGKITIWKTTAMGDRSELTRLRGVISLMLRGLPARWYRDADNTSAWAYSEWWGYVDVMLSPSMRSYADRWARDDLPEHLSIPLEFVEFDG